MKLHVLSALAAATLVLPAAASAQVVNGDFSAGLAGWDVAGDADAATGRLWLTTAAAGFDDDGEGTGALNLSGHEVLAVGGGAGTLESFFGLAGGAFGLDESGAVTGHEGSGALQSFTAQAGDVLTFQWQFGTRDMLGDAAFVVIDGQVTSLATFADAAQPGNTLWNTWQTGVGTFTHTFATAGTHTLGFAVMDTGDSAVSSSLAIDSVVVSPVPEPGTLALMLAGAGVIAMRRRRHGA